MELLISDEKTKEIFTEILIDLVKTRKDLFSQDFYIEKISTDFFLNSIKINYQSISC